MRSLARGADPAIVACGGSLIDFSRRSEEPEVIDFPERVDSGETAVVLCELAQVNRWLGGAAAALGPVKRLIEGIHAPAGDPVRVIDFGAGGADIAMDLAEWARRRQYQVRITALDFNLEACRFARRQAADWPEINVVCGDALAPCFKPGQFDFVLCSAFLHHFSDPQIVGLLTSLGKLASRAIIVNDLHRSRLAHFGIRLLTRLLSRSEAVKNDGPLSVLKGFRREELERLVKAAGFQSAEIKWRWAFRYSVVLPARQ